MENINWITKDTIFSYMAGIDQKGWGLLGDPKVECWHLVYRSYEMVFDIYLDFTEEWVYFQVPILKPGIKIKYECQSALFEYLLRLNDKVHLVKFSLTSDGLVLLNVEIPAETFNFIAFRNAVESIETYLDRYYIEIHIISQQPEFAGFVVNGDFGLEKDELEFRIN